MNDIQFFFLFILPQLIFVLWYGDFSHPLIINWYYKFCSSLCCTFTIKSVGFFFHQKEIITFLNWTICFKRFKCCHQKSLLLFLYLMYSFNLIYCPAIKPIVIDLQNVNKYEFALNPYINWDKKKLIIIRVVLKNFHL